MEVVVVGVLRQHFDPIFRERAVWEEREMGMGGGQSSVCWLVCSGVCVIATGNLCVSVFVYVCVCLGGVGVL